MLRPMKNDCEGVERGAVRAHVHRVSRCLAGNVANESFSMKGRERDV
jgi:hypothetical protein